MANSDDSPNTDENRTPQIASGANIKLLSEIVAKVKDPGVLGVFFISIVAFGALWSGVNTFSVLSLAILLLIAVLALRLVPSFLDFKTESKKLDIDSRERQQKISDRRAQRKLKHEKRH